ncbi:hypothetical protein BHYA_0203g00070 [Botrytis hyacinthi]|uniref:Uncharacterized protein n=1 Tax=Botrytis hyacinthi TaxID=278943 RepID=A0A4Z1GFU6_9HELO|nr:hypothetical protein BHYA_0203g00070 [Botrytis hyacinthi]
MDGALLPSHIETCRCICCSSEQTQLDGLHINSPPVGDEKSSLRDGTKTVSRNEETIDVTNDDGGEVEFQIEPTIPLRDIKRDDSKSDGLAYPPKN